MYNNINKCVSFILDTVGNSNFRDTTKDRSCFCKCGKVNQRIILCIQHIKEFFKNGF